MIKNREFWIILAVQILILVTGVVLGSYDVLPDTMIIVAAGALIILCGFLQNWYRYREIKKLADYITSFSYGHESLDMMDNREGELSILKNELYKLCLTLIHQKELLKKDKRYLADAISDISHQLKTPITSITVMADLLENDMVPPQKRREFTHNIQAGLKRMDWLVQALLKSARLDAGSVILKKETVFIKDLITDGCKSIMIPMELKNQTLVVDGPEGANCVCDRAWTMEAVSNIVKNCMEHTKEGGKITISYGENNLYCSIVIEDNGAGISKEDLPHIFKRFYRGKNSSSDSVGIGLALSRQIITLQKGTVDVVSTEGVGTRFTIKFYR